MSEQIVGVIGGSGLYELEGLKEVELVSVKTPFGDPSDAFRVGRLGGIRVVFLPRHGRGHRIQPSSLNFRANIYAMKMLGVEWIIGVSAVGSMKESIHPGNLVIPHQFIDRTFARPNTFFDDGIVAHVAFADPVCPDLSRILFEAATKLKVTVQKGGTSICIEGPQFSTRAESNLYRTWGVDVIGMTSLPEARLAREAEICYATLAFATDYDCWHETAGDVSIQDVLKILAESTQTAKRIIQEAVPHLPDERRCPCATALRDALITAPEMIPDKAKRDLQPIIGKYIV